MARAWKRPDTGVWYVLHGRKGKIKIGPDKKAAEFLAQKINVEEAQRRAGLIPKEDPTLLKRPLIEDLEEYWNYYLQWSQQNHRPNSHKRYGSILRNLQIFLAAQFPQVSRLGQLEPLVFEKYKLYRKETLISRNGYPLTPAALKKLEKAGRPASPARDTTVNVELEIFRAIFNHAVEKGFLEKNPLKGVRLLEVREVSEERVLSTEEAERFLKHVRKEDPEDYDIFSLLLHTGMRLGEVRHLAWPNVDLKRRVIHIRPFEFTNPLNGKKTFWSAKSKHARGKREIPIDDAALLILERHEKGANDLFVFSPYTDPGKWNKKVRMRLMRYMKAIGIPEFTRPHWLRHTFISWLAMAGKPKESIMDVVGHVEEDTFERYRHTTQEHRASLLDAVNLNL
ncbi:MAG TPA: tyrosine-type recombinase/integrase [Planctomycetota bacterium]|nr:tyrosine-type recombinase/integrase [Planctomycetota bacterium]